MHKHSVAYQISNVWCFYKSPGPVRKHLQLINCTQKRFSSKTLIITFFFNPNNTYKLWSIEMLMIRLNSFNIIDALGRKISLKSVRF